MSTQEKEIIIPQDSLDKFSKKLIKIGLVLVSVAFLFLFIIFYPVLKEEVKYFFEKNDTKTVVSLETNDKQEDALVPIDTLFGIVIPKIKANAKIIEDVDPYKSSEYQRALTLGVAHAKGSSTPDKGGNTFLFAHSSDNFYNANRYNSVFYLLTKLELGDEIVLIKDKVLYTYQITEKTIVEADRVEYLSPDSQTNKVTLMTCWPPGTTLKRLVVVGELKQTQ